MTKYHNINKISFINGSILILVDNHNIILPLEKVSKRLLNASQKEKEDFEITPSGYGIHWELIDEDLSIDGLLRLANVIV